MSNARPKGYRHRLDLYLRRYGYHAGLFKWEVDYLTPKQRRRLFHKAGRHDRLVMERIRKSSTYGREG